MEPIPCRVEVVNRQRRLHVAATDIRRAALAAAARGRCPHKMLTIVVVGDRRMRELNRAYAGVDGTTDVLAFDLSADAPADVAAQAGGEVIVNAAVAVEEAARRHREPRDELLLYVVHGVLHLAGYRDRTAAQKMRMRAAEAAVMRALARRAPGGR